MAIQAGWVGSQAVAETGQRWVISQRVAVRLPGAGWMSELIGRSKEQYITISASEGYNKDWLIGALRGFGNAPVIINTSGNIISYSAAVPLFEFPWDLQNEYIQININGGALFGRGGAGGGVNAPGGANGQNGGHAISNYIGTRLRINNGGSIIGGGGGGGCVYYQNNANTRMGGGGGAPLGAGGYGGISSGATADYWTGGRGGPGSDGNEGGPGGNNAASGGNAHARGTSSAGFGAGPGWAVVGQAPTWVQLGNIVGQRV